MRLGELPDAAGQCGFRAHRGIVGGSTVVMSSIRISIIRVHLHPSKSDTESSTSAGTSPRILIHHILQMRNEVIQLAG